jgi:soluble lytic murein transglycosylase-like protein
MATQCGSLDAPRFRVNVRGFRLRTKASWAPTAGLITAIVTLAALPAHACWDEAAARYRVSSELLYAIARTESALDPQAVGRNRNGTRDIGLMQINSAWLPTLAVHGIGERDLFDPCTSIHVGAWILAGNVQRLGYTWDAVGAYNAVSPALRRAYVDKVSRHLRSADDSAHRARRGATRTAITRGDHRAPVVATLP